MKYVAFDTETFLLNQTGKATTLTVPRMVCLSYAEQGQRPGLLERARAVHYAKELFLREDVELIGHNVAFDLLVVTRAVREELGFDLLPRIFELFDQGRIHDTIIRESLYDIERGGRFRRGAYGLADLVKRRLGVEVKGKSGPDVWRMRYNELDGVPTSKYPEAAFEYAILDAVYTLGVFEDQPEYIPAADFQVASDFVLSLASAWGVLIDAEWAYAVDGWFARVEAHAFNVLLEQGIALECGKIPSKGKQALIHDGYRAIGQNPPLTPSGQISTAADTIADLEKKGYSHPAFRALIDYNRASKYRATYLDPILSAADEGAPLCGRFNVLVDSTRTSSSSPNMQNMPSRPTPRARFAEMWFGVENGVLDEEGKRVPPTPYQRLTHPEGFALGPDIRGCIVPRKGNVIIGADYAAIEMAGLAQVIHNLGLVGAELGALGKSINAGEDQHLRVVAAMRSTTYEHVKAVHDDWSKAIKEHRIPEDLTIDFDRFTAKSANYSFPVGAAASTWRDNLVKFGVDMSLPEAERVRAAWYAAWPEMRAFHEYVSSLEGGDGMYEVPLHGPSRQVYGWTTRKTDRFTSAGNSLFQSIVASGAKLAVQSVAHGQYVEKDSPLYGSRTIVFEHDAVYMETPVERAKEAGEELTKRMVDAMKVFIPDVLVEAKYEIYPERWSFK